VLRILIVYHSKVNSHFVIYKGFDVLRIWLFWSFMFHFYERASVKGGVLNLKVLGFGGSF